MDGKLEGNDCRPFLRWWLSEGFKHMPRGDQPPEHAAIAELAWNEATLAEHQSHVEYENELYATLVDPVAEGSIKEAEMRKQLLESARWYRQHVHDLETQLNTLHGTLTAQSQVREATLEEAAQVVCGLMHHNESERDGILAQAARHIRALAASSGASIIPDYAEGIAPAGAQVTGEQIKWDLLAVAEWAVYALEHGSHVEVHWLQTVAKGKHQWAREVIANAALARQSQPPMNNWLEIRNFAESIRDDFDVADGVSAAGARKIQRIVDYANERLSTRYDAGREPHSAAVPENGGRDGECVTRPTKAAD
jgi:hypothetical protein